MNKYLRGEKLSAFDDLEVIRSDITNISTAIPKLPKWDEVVYRGMDTERFSSVDELNQFFQEMSNNSLVTMPAFTSTSINREVAERFSKGRIIFKIKSRRGVYLGKFSSAGGESEILFDKQSIFKIVNVQQEGFTGLIELEEL